MPVVLCYGDSNTHGTMPMADISDMGRFDPDVRWPGVMAEALGDGWTVIEEGLPGRTTVHDDPIEGAWKNGLAVLPAVLETHRPIDLVVILLGGNDLKARFAVTAADIAESCGRLVREVRGSSAGPAGRAPRVLLVAPPPLREVGCLSGMFEGAEAKAAGLAPAIAAVAERHGVAFFDAGRVAAVDPLDGVHYSEDTHGALGLAIADEVRAALQG
ncbi:hydrolase [Rhodobacterales bacterium HKCCE2091]|nr:hydrolase [Rhodobacterales bacterium HKCCE2091]